MGGVPWGGSEELWCSAAGRLLKAGHTVVAHVFDWHPPPAKLVELERNGARIVRRARSSPYWKRAMATALGLPNNSDPFGRRDVERTDLVIISQGYTLDGLPAMAACRRRAWPYVSIVQANGELFWPSDSQAHQARACYGAARLNYFVSRRNQELLCDQIGTAIHGEILSNPFSVSHDPNVSPPSDLGPWRLACIGRLDPVPKGQDVLLRVLALEKWRQRPVHVNFFGDGRCADLLRRMASRLSLTSTTFMGHVEDVHAIWQEHDALILPSRMEGTPLALIEAMLCSRTAIVTDVAGNGELIEDNVSGFLAKAPTEELLDEALERAWQRRGEMTALGRAARERVLEMVPADPVGDFGNRLVQLTESSPHAGR